MKSRLLKVYDLDKAIDEYAWNPVCDNSEIQEKIYQEQLKYKSYVSGDSVEWHSVITIEMKCETKKFNRKTKILVGSGMFDKEFEQEVLNKKINISYTYNHSIVGAIEYVILNAQILCIHPLTEDQVRTIGIPGVNTESDYYQYLVNKSKRKDILIKCNDFFEQFYLPKCDFVVDDEELQYLIDNEMERCRKIAIENGIVFDEMSENDLLGAVGQPSIPKFIEMITKMYTKILGIVTIGVQVLGIEDNFNYEDRYEIYNKVFYYVSDHIMGEYIG